MNEVGVILFKKMILHTALTSNRLLTTEFLQINLAIGLTMKISRLGVLLTLFFVITSNFLYSQDSKVIVPPIMLSEEDREVLKQIDVGLKAANDGAEILAVWAPIIEVMTTNPGVLLTKTIVTEDVAGLSDSVKGVKGLSKIWVLKTREDCLKRRQFYLAKKQLHHRQFWETQLEIYNKIKID